MRITFIAAVSSVMAGCSLFTSLGGFSNGDDDKDASTTDGGSGEGSVVDGAIGDAADGGRLCATTDATFCEDFDDPSDPLFKNWSIQQDTAATVDKSSVAFSAPNALETVANASTGSEKISAYIYRRLDSAKRVRSHYRFRIEDADTAGYAQIGHVEMDTANGAGSSIRLRVENGKAHIEAAIYPTPNNPTFPNLTNEFPVANGVWHELEFTCDWEAIPARITIDFDGTRYAEGRTIDGSTFGPGKVLATSGMYYLANAKSRWRVLFDDVAMWVE